MTNKNSEGLKLMLTEKLDSKIQETLQKLEEKKAEVLESTSLPGTLQTLAHFYGNTIEQGELMVEVIKDQAQSDFFRTAKSHIGTNHIRFENDTHSVQISKSLLREFSWGREKLPRAPKLPNVDPIAKNIFELWDYQSKLIEGVNYKEFAEIYIEYVERKQPSYFNTRKVTNEQIEIMVAEASQKMKEYEMHYKQYEADLEEFNKVEKEDVLFYLEIKEDINTFKKEGWNTKHSNIHPEALKFASYVN